MEKKFYGTTIVYLNREEVLKLYQNEKLVIQMNDQIKNSDRIILRPDQNEET